VNILSEWSSQFGSPTTSAKKRYGEANDTLIRSKLWPLRRSGYTILIYLNVNFFNLNNLVQWLVLWSAVVLASLNVGSKVRR